MPLESMQNTVAVVLAAGRGTRMKSDLPKVLHRICGRSLLGHIVHSLRSAGVHRLVVVTGHGREQVLAELDSLGVDYTEAWQKEQKGTGHAAQTALSALKSGDENVFILNGDGPLLESSTFIRLRDEFMRAKADLLLACMELENPFGYGRVATGAGGKVLKSIVEEKEANAKEKKIKLVNGGLYLVKKSFLAAALAKLKPSGKTGEIYLTDIVAAGAKAKKKMLPSLVDAAELSGVNDLLQLAEAEEAMRARLVTSFLAAGVRFQDRRSVYLDASVVIEAGAEIGANVTLTGSTWIGRGSKVETGAVIKDSRVAEGAVIKAYSYLDNAAVAARAQVGPFAHLRPSADIGEDCRIGNFVEVKKSRFGRGSKASHLSYIGDAEVGEEVNIGCGVITCNYDGVNKHKTIIRDKAFVGSDVQLIAPVEVGAEAYVATGTTVNRNVPAGALAIGRQKQENKEGYASRLRSRMLAQKKNKQGV